MGLFTKLVTFKGIVHQTGNILKGLFTKQVTFKGIVHQTGNILMEF